MYPTQEPVANEKIVAFKTKKITIIIINYYMYKGKFRS